MKNALALVALTCSLISAIAQINYPGQPFSWPDSRLNPGVPTVYLQAPDRAMLALEDLENDQYKEFGYRFGVEQPLTLNCMDQSLATEYRDRMVWQSAIAGPGAVSMNFTFSHLQLPKGATMYIWEVDGDQMLGSFDHRSNSDGGSFAVGLIYADQVVIEIQADVSTDTSLIDVQLQEVVYGYRDILSRWYEEEQAWLSGSRGPFGNSGACNVNINCPEGIDWTVESRSVALIVDGGYAACTGALVNNTAQDGTPYFLTANHCLGGEEDWVFYFNHESSSCSGSNGPIDDTVSGSILRANNAGSDFALLELNETPPLTYDVQYAGWDNSDDNITLGVSIHHPAGDVKKIAIEENDPTQTDWGDAQTWRIEDWDVGVTEPGSSGAPLFDQNHRVVGQLFGGSAACSGDFDNDQPDYYGRFAVSWDGSSAATRLRDWLDPGNTGIEVLDGWPDGAISYNNDGASAGLVDIPEEFCNEEAFTPSLRLLNNGQTLLTSATIITLYNGAMQTDILWEGYLASGEYEDVELAEFQPEIGPNSISVTAETPFDENLLNNGSTADFDVVLAEEIILIDIQTDQYGYETYWQLTGPGGEVLISGGNLNVGADGAGLANATNDDPGAYSAEAMYSYEWPASEEGCYEFLIVDDYEDGICCDYGEGFFLVQDGNGTIIASGGEFGGSSMHSFGVTATSTDIGAKQVPQIKLSPNPGTGNYRLSIPLTVEETRVLNALGQTVYFTDEPWKAKQSFDLSHLGAGAYFFNLTTSEGVFSTRFMQH